MVEVYAIETIKTEEIEEKIVNKKKRKFQCENQVVDDALITLGRYNKIILTLTKPSYLLRTGPGSMRHFRWEHSGRLCKLLRQLVIRHNWKEAAGVLSVLLQGTRKDRRPQINRLKYSALMELHKRIHGIDFIHSKISNTYDTWTSRAGSSRDLGIGDRYMVYLEQILFFLSEDNEDDASNAAISLMQRPDFGALSMAYMVIGLTFYQLWYSKFLKEMQSPDVEKCDTLNPSEMSHSSFRNQVGQSMGSAAYSHGTGGSFRHESETSVMNEKRVSIEASVKLESEYIPLGDLNLKQESVPQLVQPLGVYLSSSENHGSLQNNDMLMYDASLFSTLGNLESWLLPLRLPQNSEYHMQILNDPYYKDAVKYLQLGLSSTPPALAALLPLIQLLLIGGQMDTLMTIVEQFCIDSSGVLPFRVRATILECFNPYNDMLPNYYEDVLKKDPTCSNSLTKLISMHYNGCYSSESLLEMLASHLEATYPEFNTWKELASCFLRLASYEEDQLSVCLDGTEGKQRQHIFVRYNSTPKLFLKGKSGSTWRFRCKWWLTRHFSDTMLSSEIASGDMRLPTYKAAVAAHMYGYDFNFVVEVYNLLSEDIKNRDLFQFLKMHVHNSLRIAPNYVNRNGF